MKSTIKSAGKIFATCAVVVVACASLAKADEDAAHLVWKGLQKTWQGTKWTVNKLDEGGLKTVVAVKDGVVYAADKTADGTKVAYSEAIKPYVVTPVVEFTKVAAVDGVYDVVVQPVAKGAKAAWDNDLVTGAKVYGKTVSSTKAYKVTIVPVQKGFKKAGHGILRASCETANGFRDKPKSCTKPKFTAEMYAN